MQGQFSLHPFSICSIFMDPEDELGPGDDVDEDLCSGDTPGVSGPLGDVKGGGS